jgi:hypothetical protein
LFLISDEDATRSSCENLAVVSVLVKDAMQNELGYSLERYDESPGVYYESKGVANLYNVEWKTIIYVNLDKIHEEVLALRRYLHHTDVLCHTKFVRN